MFLPREAKNCLHYSKVSLGQDVSSRKPLKLRPVELRRTVFISADGHIQDIKTVINQGLCAAGRVLTLLSHDTSLLRFCLARVNEKKCMGCEAVLQSARMGAIGFRELNRAKKALLILYL